MEKRYRNILGAGLALFAAILVIDLWFFNDLYLSGIALILLAVLGMSLFIMQDSVSLPEIGVVFTDDAKGIVVINRGNDDAVAIHVALVPINAEFDIPSLAPDARYIYALPSMLPEVKAAVTYRNTQGIGYARTFMLSALGKSDDDLLKPMFPLFKWQ